VLPSSCATFGFLPPAWPLVKKFRCNRAWGCIWSYGVSRRRWRSAVARGAFGRELGGRHAGKQETFSLKAGLCGTQTREAAEEVSASFTRRREQREERMSGCQMGLSRWRQSPKLWSRKVVCLLIWFWKLFLWLLNKQDQTKAVLVRGAQKAFRWLACADVGWRRAAWLQIRACTRV